MKVINYEKTNGSFKIKYLDDNQIISGTINVDSNSLNLNALTTKLIIDNSVGDKVKIENDQIFESIEKKMIVEYDVCNEFNYFENFNLYNTSDYISNTNFKNVLTESSPRDNIVYFQFYYKTEETRQNDTVSYKLSNFFSKGARYSDSISPKGYFEELDLLCRVFKTNFLSKMDLNIDDYYYCCVPKKNKSGNCPLKEIINEITKRNVILDYSDVFENQEKMDMIKNKKIILIDDIVPSEEELIKYKDKLIKNGADAVIMYSYGKSSAINLSIGDLE